MRRLNAVVAPYLVMSAGTTRASRFPLRKVTWFF